MDIETLEAMSDEELDRMAAEKVMGCSDPSDKWDPTRDHYDAFTLQRKIRADGKQEEYIRHLRSQLGLKSVSRSQSRTSLNRMRGPLLQGSMIVEWEFAWAFAHAPARIRTIASLATYLVEE